MDHSTYAKFEQIINLYNNGSNCRQIADLLSTRIHIIYNILNKHGVKLRNNSESKILYNIDQQYFDIIDTEEKAYFLGFIYADGHNNRKNNAVILSLKSADINIVQRLNNLIQDKQVKTYTDKQNYTRVSLQITNKHISETLEKIGVLQDKTHHCVFPTLNPILNRHFIRGYFDGDGSIFYTTNKAGTKNYRCSFVGTKIFLLELEKILTMAGITCHIDKAFYDKTNVVTKLYLTSSKQCEKLFPFLYDKATIYLDRKHDRFIQMNDYRSEQNKRICLYCNKPVFGKNLCYEHIDHDKIESNTNFTRSKKIDIAILKTMLTDNFSQTAIAKYFGVSCSSIYKMIKKRHLAKQ